MIPITGLWEGTDKNQNQFFSGNLGNARLVIFKNRKKEKDNQPDFILYIDQKQKKQDDNQQQQPQPSQPQAPAAEDDLPF